MKSILLITSLSAFCSLGAWAQELANKEVVTRISPQSTNAIEVPCSFADNDLTKASLQQQLAGKQITKIELVYTRYKLNPKFDQNALNDQRVRELKKQLPQLSAKDISWVWVEQTGAQNADEARDYFHGFRIHYTEAPTTTQKTVNLTAPTTSTAVFQRRTFEDAANPATHLVVDNSKGTTFNHPSGTVLHIPANCVVDANGKPVNGNYDIYYTEYRDAAQMAYSGIPMAYSHGGVDYNFSSVGMYEMRGKQNDQELSLTKPITVDFNCTEVAEGVDFYEMDDQSGKWKQVAPITFPSADVALTTPEEMQNNSAVSVNNVTAFGKSERPLQRTASQFESTSGMNPDKKAAKGSTMYTLTAEMFKRYTNMKTTKAELFAKGIVAENPEYYQLTINNSYAANILNEIRGISNPLPDGMDAGHFFPELVVGLQSPNFGVYNCDQVRRIQNEITASPKYVDKGDNEMTYAVACVIDMKLNASLSFDPKAVHYDSKGESVILLFNGLGGLSVVTAETIKDAKGATTPTLQVEDLSDKVKDSNDLKKYLKL